ncbi:MAG: HAD-IA family hydrolase, partial [Clostridia bacterium]|nr:HAD-IA family hydrolase [Clostridia bacterium]
ENNLGLNATLIDDDVLPTLEFLKTKAKIYAVTNGIKHVQLKRLEKSGIARFLDGKFISAETGYSKPSKEYFEYVESHIEGFVKDEALLVGDSMTADIPAAKFGYRTCLVAPYDKDISGYPVQPEYRVEKFSQIKKFFTDEKSYVT